MFSDNEDLETGKRPDSTVPETLNSSDTSGTCTGKTVANNENKGVTVNTEKTTKETLAKTGETHISVVNNTQSKEPTSPKKPSVNTEKTGDIESSEPECTSFKQDLDNSTTKDIVSAENSIVNAENNIANLEKQTIDNEINKQNETGAPVTTENNVDKELSIPNHVNTVNTTETDKEVTTATNKSPNINDLSIQ